MQTVDISSAQVEAAPIRSRRRLFWLLSSVAAIFLLALSIFLTQYYFGPPATLQVTTARGLGSVKIDDGSASPILFKSDLSPGSHKITISDDSHAATPWIKDIPITRGTLTSVDIDLGPSAEFTSSVILSLTRGSQLTIQTNPDKAQVFLDGDNLGSDTISRHIPGPGTHTITLKKDGYLDKVFQVNVVNGFNLNINATIFKNPSFTITPVKTSSIVPTTGPDLQIASRTDSGLSKISGTLAKPQTRAWTSAELFNLNAPDSSLPAQPLDWLKGLYYHELLHTKLSDIPFHYFIDESGKIYEGRAGGKDSLTFDPGTSLETTAANPILIPGVAVVGYLGQKDKVTDAALDSFTKLVAFLGRTGPTPTVQQVKILNTSVGFLRVRKSPSTSATEVTHVKPGETYELVKEQNGWIEIKLPDGTLGWVDSKYVQKI